MKSVTTYKRQILLLVCAMTMACANRGIGPQGGPKDETPPKILKETPANGTTDFEGNTVLLEFDEYVQLDKVADNVLVSPPQQRPPEVKAIGKRVIVRFDGEMIDSTTYTIDFGSAICDNNEKNPITDYSFSFSTGPVIDTLQIGGQLLNAEDLNPVSNIIVGIHSNHADSAFEKLPFSRIAKTDAQGRFNIKNIKSGTYRLYALNDASKDYFYQPGEGLAMYDSLLTPSCYRDLATDTLWKDTITQRMVEGERVRDTLTIVDTIITKEKTFYKPDSIVLVYFKEDKVRQYFIRAVREQRHLFTLYFNSAQRDLPTVKPLGSDWLKYTLCQPSENNDTINYWLTDSLAMSIDTLEFELTYLKSDSLYQLQPQTDTVRAVYREPRLTAAARAKRDKQQQERVVELKTNTSQKFDVYVPFKINSETPIDTVNHDMIHLYQMVDTVHKPLKFTLQADSVKMRFEISQPWEPETEYQLIADSGAFVDIYGKANEKQTYKFKILSLDQYSTLIVKLDPYIDNVVIQILTEKDKVVRELAASAEGTKFEYLKPTSYYMRAFVDLNGDGKWTTGDWATKRQPEPVYYFPNKLTLRANWDFEEAWDIRKLPIDRQKPQELRSDANAKKK